MSGAARHPPMLHGLVRRFRDAGLKLSVRDYLEGLAALERFPEPFAALQGARAHRDPGDDGDVRFEPGVTRIRQREEIVWFCQTMWARSDDERRLVRDIVTREIRLAPPDLALDVIAALREPGASPGAPIRVRAPTYPEEAPAPEKPTTTETREAAAPPAAAASEVEELSEDGGFGLALEEGAGIPVPQPPEPDPEQSRRYVFEPEPLISPLWLTALWRRLFRPVRRIDRNEIDAEETIRQALRQGGLLRPAFKVRRVNSARLLVLLDASTAMAPWHAFEDSLRESVLSRGSRLAEVGVRHFSGLPRSSIYESPSLHQPRRLDRLFESFRGAPLLVFGEAGAATAPRRDFAARLDQFLALAAGFDVKPLVWINPMPQSRWQPAMTARLGAYPHAHLLPLDAESLLRAVDILRGNRQ